MECQNALMKIAATDYVLSCGEVLVVSLEEEAITEPDRPLTDITLRALLLRCW